MTDERADAAQLRWLCNGHAAQSGPAIEEVHEPGHPLATISCRAAVGEGAVTESRGIAMPGCYGGDRPRAGVCGDSGNHRATNGAVTAASALPPFFQLGPCRRQGESIYGWGEPPLAIPGEGTQSWLYCVLISLGILRLEVLGGRANYSVGARAPVPIQQMRFWEAYAPEVILSYARHFAVINPESAAARRSVDRQSWAESRDHLTDVVQELATDGPTQGLLAALLARLGELPVTALRETAVPMVGASVATNLAAEDGLREHVGSFQIFNAADAFDFVSRGDNRRDEGLGHTSSTSVVVGVRRGRQQAGQGAVRARRAASGRAARGRGRTAGRGGGGSGAAVPSLASPPGMH